MTRGSTLELELLEQPVEAEPAKSIAICCDVAKDRALAAAVALAELLRRLTASDELRSFSRLRFGQCSLPPHVSADFVSHFFAIDLRGHA